MKKILTAFTTMVFLAVVSNGAMAQSAPDGTANPKGLHQVLPIEKPVKRNKAPDPNLPKPGEKVHPKGKFSHVRKWVKGGAGPVPHPHPTKTAQ